MLKNLKIQNYALIQNLDIELNDDFSILTGETGAGKSILLGALSLVLGERADSSALKNNENKCVVEGLFDIQSYQLDRFFKEKELDYEPLTLIRREINNAGKSRAFVNDTPVNLNILKELASLLVDLHSQHESLQLNDNSFQLSVIDSVAKNGKLLDAYRNAYQQYKELKKKLDELKQQSQRDAADYDYDLFQFNQLADLKLDNLDQKALEDELKMLTNAEDIQQNLSVCFSVISDGEPNILNQLKLVKQAIGRIKPFYSKAELIYERIESVAIELKDIAHEAEEAAEAVEFNPNRAIAVKEILDKLYACMHKHQVDTVSELIVLRIKFESKLTHHDDADFELKQIENEILNCENSLLELASALTKQRTEAAVGFKQKVTKQLADLGMPNARFQVAVDTNSHFYPDGCDKIAFLFSANKNQPEENISKIASGGEISRLMLSIKSILSESKALPTIIFDEIDTGVSGEIADKMASIMKNMAKNMQVISITHLPQIAARGKNHYKVFKEEDEHSVQTRIIRLSENERIEEIARLLSGKDISKAAIENAKALINS